MSNITLFICKHFSEYFKNIRTFLKHITIYQYNTKKLIIPKHHQILSLKNSLMSTQVFLKLRNLFSHLEIDIFQPKVSIFDSSLNKNIQQLCVHNHEERHWEEMEYPSPLLRRSCTLQFTTALNTFYCPAHCTFHTSVFPVWLLNTNWVYNSKSKLMEI